MKTPLNRGLLLKSFREIWPVTAAMCVLLILATTAIAFVGRQVGASEFASLMKSGFLQGMISSIMGARVTADLGVLVVRTLAWTDPVILLIYFAHRATICTQLPAGEIDRGTIDILMGLPVSRWQTYIAHTLIWMASGIVLLLAGVAGDCCGTHLAHDTMAPAPRIAMIFVNGYCFYLCWGGFCYFVSTLCARRGRAVTIILFIIILLTMMASMADVWAPARLLNTISPINYFRPFYILRDGQWPYASMAILTVSGAAFWLTGGIIYHRRDLNTV